MCEDATRRDGGADGTLLAVSVVTHAGRVDVRITGDVDLTTRDAFAALLDVAAGLAAHVHLDLSGVGFLDPQGALLLARRQATHPRFEITCASASVRRIVEILEQLDGVGRSPRLDGGSNCDASET